MGAIVAIAYLIITPTGEKFTEFYVTALDGNATDYPNELTIGEEGRVILSIANHEHRDDMIYQVEIIIDGEDNSRIGPIALDHDEKWEEETSFTPQETGENQKVEFILYKQGREEPYRSLHLWLDVVNAG